MNDTNPQASEGRQAPPAPEPPVEAGEQGSAVDDLFRSEINKYRDLYLRSQAELDNFRKRAQRDRDDAVRYANNAFLERLLPILDNFELGLDAARKSPEAAGIVQGMAMVHKQLQDFLRQHDVEVIDAHEAVFDPNIHEAVGHEAHESTPDGAVIRQLRRGYKLRDRLIRPASVIVSSGADAAGNEPKKDAEIPGA